MEKQQTNQLQKLQSRVSSKNKSKTPIESVVDLIREFSCLSDVIGREFEVFDAEGKLKYTIKQKPISSIQLNVLINELGDLKQKEQGRTPKIPKRGRR